MYICFVNVQFLSVNWQKEVWTPAIVDKVIDWGETLTVDSSLARLGKRSALCPIDGLDYSGKLRAGARAARLKGVVFSPLRSVRRAELTVFIPDWTAESGFF